MVGVDHRSGAEDRPAEADLHRPPDPPVRTDRAALTEHPRRAELSADGTQYYDGPDWGWQELWLTADEVFAFCAEDRGLPATQVSLLAEGLLNQSWKIECSDHDRVLRVSRSERTPEQVAYELPVVRAWAEAAPVVVAAEHEDVPVVDDRVLTIFPYVKGFSGLSMASPDRTRELIPVVAAMHRVSLGLDLRQRPGFTSIDEQPRWADWTVARSAVIERFGRGADILGPVSVIDQAIEELDQQLDRWTTAGRLADRAPIHGDLNPRNQLYLEDSLVAIIDTDDLRVDPLVWEVANLAYTDLDVDPGRVWRDYLEAGGPLDPADEELLLPFARLGVLGELRWLTDADGAAVHTADQTLFDLAAALTGRPTRD
ncbi:phosphotransferase enzyme family protein [Microlunatus parietis]